MRFSDGVKRYDKDTKKRIFDEIIAAAEKDSAAGDSHADSKAVITGQQNTEENIMKNTNEKARIRNSRGGVIAAACAVLVVGGGIFAAGRMSEDSNGAARIGAAGVPTSYTTDVEDEIFTESTAENSRTDEEVISIKNDNTDDETWRNESDEDTIRLVDNSDFIGLLQIVNIQKENIDGVEYTDYFCSLIDEDGNAGVVFKYTEDEIPTRLSIMEKAQAEELLHKGDKILVYAKKGVQSTSGGYSLELTDDLTIFKWSGDAKRYVNVYRPGDFITDRSQGEPGEYNCGLYEMGLETYFKDRLVSMCGESDYSAVKNWCDFNGLPFFVETESGQPFPKGTITKFIWANDTDAGVNGSGVTVNISDGLSYTGENGNDEDEQAATELNVSDKGKTIKEFADYNLELGGLFYEEDDNTYGVVIDVTKKDGTYFDHGEWVENHMDLVYGDVQPIMELTECSFMESGLSWLTEDDSKMKVACIFHADKPLAEVSKDVPVTLQVNTVRRESGEEEEGLFEVTFNIDITDIK
jgi:hypothetical protein